jgi:GT2 family glycosyltransferase/glycosyltransferase involved in cell wall biosynthesis/SAM-dependent methyltransferase
MIPNTLIKAASFSANSLQFPNAWIGHLPFAAWVVQELSPKIFVELGTHSGNSYFAFCQSVVEAGLSTKCYAVDTWHGDEHAGKYTDEIFTKVNQYHQENYAGFSQLLRMTFDDAAGYFADESIDMLHIDGLHTYEAVRHDFETWLPKLAPGAVVLFHDTNVREHNFAVWKLWKELQVRYPNNVEFLHSHGLGVLQLNNAPIDKKLVWLQADEYEKQRFINYFAAIGCHQLNFFELKELRAREATSAHHHELLARDKQIASYHHAALAREEQLAILSNSIIEREEIISQIYASTSWRITTIIRELRNLFLRVYERLRKFGRKKFDSDWYLRVNPDVANSGVDPYQHYMLYGKAEGRRPRPVSTLIQNAKKNIFRFLKEKIINVCKYFYKQIPFSKNFKYRIQDYCYRHFSFLFRGEPSYEFWYARRLSSEGANLVGRNINWGLTLPRNANNTSLRSAYPWCVVDIIIPVYKGLKETQRCINSVINSAFTTPFRLIVINDASPEAEITKYLRSLISLSNVIIIENDKNLGFTATVNRGMSLSNTNDVLLLNSDTEVSNDWLDKIKAHAYSESRVGTVTPFSNNATICSYPTLDGMKELPDGESVQSMDAAFASANTGLSIEIPTAIGFCMYIRRDCLKEVGLFDVETFGKGYGEENDFCLRATANKWKHLLAADTFVFHEGEVSFQEDSNQRKALATKIICKRYPHYETDVAKHIAKNEAYPLRFAATAERIRQAGVPVVLHVLHGYGGGTQKHVEELCLRNYGKSKQLIMTPPFPEVGKTGLQIRSADPTDFLNINLPLTNLENLVQLIQSLGVSLIHIHHVLGYTFDLQDIIKKLGIPFYLTIHDYTLICPRIYMMQNGQNYCGEPDQSKCNQCLSIDHPQGVSDISLWRESHAWLFNEASVVICPSNDVEQRCQRYFPNAAYRFVPHESSLGDSSLDINVTPLNENEPLRVVIIGVLGVHKGAKLIEEVLLATQNTKALLQIKLIGYSDINFTSISSEYFTQTGSYDDDELEEKINLFNPHLILFSSRCPETYSYTLTAALKSKRPIMAPDLGAFPERLALRPWTWLIDWDITAALLVEKLLEVRLENFSKLIAPVIQKEKKHVESVAIDNERFYDERYLSPDNNIRFKGIIDIRKLNRITALVLIEKIDTQHSPCSYIRLILPMIRERGNNIDFRWVTAEQVTNYVADVLICQRTIVSSIAAIDKITAHCRDKHIRIVYDLDDLLLALPVGHPEYAVYLGKSAAVFRWLLEADQVWVTTEALQQHICKINPRTHVVPNYIDDKVWLKPKIEDADLERIVPVRLLYMGTPTHSDDFELVYKVLKKLKKEFAELIEINLIGVVSNHSDENWYKNISPPHDVGSQYPVFVDWLCNAPTFDIGIAPLVDNEFNRCKSAIKFMDYSVLGMATVASDINAYSMIRNGENGYKVNNTEESWYETLKKLIVNPDLRKKIQSTAQNEIFKNYGYASVQGYRTELLTLLLSVDLKINKKDTTISIKNDLDTVKVGRSIISSAFLYGVGIEIGALHNPLSVMSNVNVKYVDRMDKPSLYEQYPELRQHNLVDVDYVDDGETLLTFADNSQDFIIANHFLEHCEDPIATLKTFFRVIRNGGVVFLALPDKRFTFDKNRQKTSLHHLIQDHLDGPTTSRFEHFREWPEFVEPHFGRFYETKEEIDLRARELMNQNYSIHYHVWEPEDVYEMLHYCAVKQGLPLIIDYFLSTDDEMIIILRKKVSISNQAHNEHNNSGFLSKNNSVDNV